jgi:hypothetical protein
MHGHSRICHGGGAGVDGKGGTVRGHDRLLCIGKSPGIDEERCRVVEGQAMISGTDSDDTSATEYSSTSMPTGSRRMRRLTLGKFSSASSAAIHPPMLVKPSGRRVPPNPGWMGVRTRLWSCSASRSEKRSLDCGPAPPCSNRNGCPSPRSATISSTSPSPGAVSVVVLDSADVVTWSSQSA